MVRTWRVKVGDRIKYQTFYSEEIFEGVVKDVMVDPEYLVN